MKKILLSAAALMAMGTFAIAGGDIAPVAEETVIDTPEIMDSPDVGGFYLGLGYGYLNSTDTLSYKVGAVDTSTDLWDDSYGEIMLQAGYKFNEYVAVEGRYWFGVSDGSWLSPTDGAEAGDLSFDAYGIYVKPMYPVTPQFNIYALLGWGGVSVDIDDQWTDFDEFDGFSWGIGAEYAINENLSVFIDYTVIYDDDEEFTDVNIDGNGAYLYTVENDLSIDTINFGITYKF